jgi:molecular chaperone HscA
MSSVLCLDFGTSSIRAVLRNRQSDLSVLPIGQVTPRQTIDGASIPSAFCIEEDLDTIKFGQHALDAILSGRKLPFSETSPKHWLADPRHLGKPLLPNLPINRRDVLAGLMGYAFFAASESGFWNVPKDPGQADIRIAHPVWPSNIREDADLALAQIAWMAVNMASEGDWGVSSIDILCSWTTPANESEIRPALKIFKDTIEPVAAAVELLPNLGNERRICMVIDVGAGTTDIGVFQYLSPDIKANKGDRIIPAGPAISVFKAGDEIDRVLFKLMNEVDRVSFKSNLTRIKSEIRFHKERLFKAGRIEVAGINLSLNALESADEIKEMTTSIRHGIENCLNNAYKNISSFASAASLSNDISVVMAGGGAEMQFLREAVSKPMIIQGTPFNFTFITSEPPRKMNMHGAGYSRLAVGLGGAQESYENVVQEHEKLVRLSSLGVPKQVIERWII